MSKKSRRRRRTVDGITKAIAAHDPEAIAAWLVGRRASMVKPIDPGFATVTARLADKLLLARLTRREQILLHIESQLRAQRKIGRRMLVYAGLIDQLMEGRAFRGCVLDQVVIYLDRRQYRDDPGVFVIPKRDGNRAFVEYRVIRAWEVDPQESARMCSRAWACLRRSVRGMKGSRVGSETRTGWRVYSGGSTWATTPS